MLFRLGILLASLAVVLVAVELVMRALDLPHPVTNFTPVKGIYAKSEVPGLRFQLLPQARSFHRFPDDPRGYFGAEGGVEYVVNSTGARDREYDRIKPPGIFRIVFLGDSFTFGTGVRLEDTFVKRVESSLNAEGARKIEAINFGVPGYDTREEVLLLEHVCADFSPDLVVIVMFLNDGHGGYSDEVFNLDIGENWSRIYRAFRLAVERRRAERELIDSWNASFRDGSPAWARIEGALRRAADLSGQRDFELAVVIFPVMYWLDGEYPFREAHKRIAGFVDSLGVPVLDLYPAFRGEDGRSLWVHASNQHPNERAHAIAGRAISEFFGEAGLLEATGPPRTAKDYYDLSRQMARDRRWREAIGHLQSAIRLDPHNEGARYGLGRLMVRHLEPEEVVAYYRQEVHNDPKPQASHYFWGVALAKGGDFDGAMSKFRDALEVDPAHELSQHRWGVLLERLGRLDDALEHYREATEIHPEFADAHLACARVLRRLSRPAEAAEHERLARESDFNTNKRFVYWARYLIRAGRHDAAVKELERALEADPDDAEARALLEQLSERTGP